MKPALVPFVSVMAGLVLAAIAGFPGRSCAQATVVEGCNELLSGEIGVRELHGAVGDSVDVAVTVHTLGSIDAFGLNLSFPSELLSFVVLSPGDLTAGFTNLSAQESGGVVTLGGFTLGESIPSGAAGRLASLRFVVIAPGTGSFATSSYVDDVQAYHSCESVHGTSPVSAASWGAIKARFQEPLTRSR
jgi:hypothetical protein